MLDVNITQCVYDYFDENAAEKLALVFKPVESQLSGKLAFQVIMRV